MQRPSKECKVLLIKNKKILTRIIFSSLSSPISLISIDRTDSLLFINKVTQQNEAEIDLFDDGKTRGHLEYCILDQNALQKEKNATNQQYKLWFDCKYDSDINMYERIHNEKLKNNHNFFHFDQRSLSLITYEDEFDSFDVMKSEANIVWDCERLDIAQFILHKIPKFFVKSLNALKVSYLRQLQRYFARQSDLFCIKKDQFMYMSEKRKECINLDWQDKDLQIKLPFSSTDLVQREATECIVLTCPYIQFTAFSADFS